MQGFYVCSLIVCLREEQGIALYNSTRYFNSWAEERIHGCLTNEILHQLADSGPEVPLTLSSYL